MATEARVTVCLTSEVDAALDALAAERNASRSSLIRHAVEEYLRRSGRPPTSTLRRWTPPTAEVTG